MTHQNEEAERLATWLDATTVFNDGKRAAALLRAQAAEIEQLKGEMVDQGPYIAKLREKVKSKDAEIERLNSGWKDANTTMVKQYAELNDTHIKLNGALARLAELDAEIERLKVDLAHTEECCVQWATDYGNALKPIDRKDALLREALAALESVLSANRVGIRPPSTVMQAERILDQIRAAATKAEQAITKIKTELWE